MKKITLLLLLMMSVVVAETPNEGVKEILKLYQSKNIEKLVNERYTELHKAKNDDEVKQVIDFLKGHISEEKSLKRFTDFFREIQDVKPELSVKDPKYVQPTETGDVAKFKAESGRTYRLYKMKNGLWGFHM